MHVQLYINTCACIYVCTRVYVCRECYVQVHKLACKIFIKLSTKLLTTVIYISIYSYTYVTMFINSPLIFTDWSQRFMNFVYKLFGKVPHLHLI